jgi:NTP pyrophosphatase (non-canonical NTP hydrolase)
VTDALEELRARLAAFAMARNWGRFHDPKNLVMALSGEVGELTALFQWTTSDEARAIMTTEKRTDVEDELADVMIYLVRLADELGVDLIAAAQAKTDRNEQRFPTV